MTPEIEIVTGDCREIDASGPFGMILADPPYGDTSLDWDRRVKGWQAVAAETLQPTASLWVFGSLRYFMAEARAFEEAGLRYAQEIVWEKHNGSGFHADRFKRVHELAVQFYRTDAAWAGVWNEVQTTPDAVQRSVKRKKGRPAHMGHIDAAAYSSEDGGPRIMRSVIYARSCHGRAIHPTEKPVDLLEILIRTSCPPGGIVCDMFAGSGAAGEAARNAGRGYVGFEIDHTMANKARERLSAKLPLVSA
ncbi:MAG: site-specific DNA-methyltransferase [Novosphingobium sp.]|nr:site-specific DNA-methyltransferase [Novosphingobium sp.]